MSKVIVMNGSPRLFGMPAEKGRWIYVAIGFFINLCMGANFSWSIYRKPLESLLHIGATQSGLPFTLFLGSFVFFTLVISRILEQFGPRRTMMLGGLVAGAGWILASFTSSITLLALCYGVVGGAGIGTAYGVPIAVSSRWIPDKRGLAVGLTLAGYGLSSLVFAPLAGHLVSAYGPFLALRVFGTGIMIMLCLAALFMRFPPAGWMACPDTASQATAGCGPEVRLHPSGLFRESAFTGLYVCYFLAALSGPMAIGISSPVAQEIIGLPVVQATAFVSVFAIFNGAGRALFGYLADELTPRYASALSFVIIILASLGMLRAGPGDVALYCICFEAFWLTMGGWIAIAPAATTTFFGSKYQIKNYGIVFTAYGIGGVLGILLSGFIKDRFGDYHYAFYPTALLALAGLVVSLTSLKTPLRALSPSTGPHPV